MDDLQEHLEILDALYGEGVWEVSKSLTDTQRQKREHRTTQALAAGNAVSAVAGPAALYSAVTHRKEGGIPRDLLRGAGRSAMKSKYRPIKTAGVRMRRIQQGLDAGAQGKVVPMKYKVGAGVAGAGLIGLQAINASVDAASAKVLSDTAKKNKVAKKLTPVSKSEVSKSEKVDIAIRGEVSKMDTEKRQVFGWASVIEVGGKPVIDLQDDVMTIETIEKAAYNYVHGSRKGGRQHERAGEEPLHVSDMIESFVLTPEKKEKMGIPEEVPTGWWVGFQIRDDDTWQQYKDGKLKDFSIHGSGRRVEVDV